jgi:hypothetical protein
MLLDILARRLPGRTYEHGSRYAKLRLRRLPPSMWRGFPFLTSGGTPGAYADRALTGMSQRKMAAEPNAQGVATPAGGQWHAATVKRVLKRLAQSGAAPRELPLIDPLIKIKHS